MSAKPFSFSLKVLVRDGAGRCLVLRRSPTSRANAGKWEFPGGKLHAGESLDEGLLREVAEETGLEVCLQRVAGAAESELPERKVAYLIMEARTDGGKVLLSDEHDDFAWVPIADLISVDLAEQFRPFAEEYCRRQTTT